MNNEPLVSVIIPTHNRKEKLIRLIDSILKSDYPREMYEIIVVDDASTDATSQELRQRYPKIKIVRSEKELYPSGSRNVGITNAIGNYIFLIDDDNIVDKKCISELVKVIENCCNVAIVAPIMYYLKQPTRVWCAGVKRNMITSRTNFIGKDSQNNGQFKELIISEDFPNAFMVRNGVFKKIALFDEYNFPIHYEEADLGERARKAGYDVVCNPKAKVWHDIPLPEMVADKTRLLHCNDVFRAHYCGRNRIIFHKKYSKWWQFLIFVLFFNWLLTSYYLNSILTSSKKPFRERLKIAKAYQKGVMEGLKWK